MSETADWQIVRRTAKTWEVYVWRSYDSNTNHVSEWETFGRLVFDSSADLYHVDIVEWLEDGYKWHRTEKRYQTYKAALNAVVNWHKRAS